MTRSRQTLLALATFVLLVPSPVVALGPEDCERWLSELREEVADADIADQDEQAALVKGLDEASLGRKGTKKSDSIKGVGEFKKKAAKLAAEGKVSRTEGERLDTLSETVRRCLEQVE